MSRKSEKLLSDQMMERLVSGFHKSQSGDKAGSVPPKVTSDVESEGETGQTITQKVLYAQIWFEGLHLAGAIDKKDIARLVAGQNGGINFKDIYDKVRDPNLIYNNGGMDAAIVREIFLKQGKRGMAQIIKKKIEARGLKLPLIKDRKK